MNTQFLQGDDARTTLEDGSCDACLKALSESYELDALGCVTVYAVEDADGSLVGFLCEECGDGRDDTNCLAPTGYKACVHCGTATQSSHSTCGLVVCLRCHDGHLADCKRTTLRAKWHRYLLRTGQVEFLADAGTEEGTR